MSFLSSVIGTVGDIGGAFIGDPGLGDQVNMGLNATGLQHQGPSNPGSDIKGVFGGGSDDNRNLGSDYTAGNLAGTAATLGTTALGVNAQASAGRAANNLIDPYYKTGLAANSKIADLSGLGPNGDAGIRTTLENLPGYKFSRDQALLGINNQASAMGLGSNALTGVAATANNYASTNYQNYFKNLLDLTGMGVKTGTQMGENDIGIGNAQAAGYVRGGNALNQGAMSGFGGNAINSQFAQNGLNGSADSYFNLGSDSSYDLGSSDILQEGLDF